MAIKRRTILAGLAGCGGLALAGGWPSAGFAALPGGGYAGVRRAADGRFYGCLIGADGKVRAKLPLPGRGHGMAASPDAQIVVFFARRPGVFALIADVRSGRQIGMITSPKGRHFYGHGVFSADGALLYAAENDFDAGRGVIGIYDARHGFKRLGEMGSGGVGPHDAVLHPDGRTLIVANGGLRTHPAYPRMPLNVADMAPNLAYVNRESGKLEEVVEPPKRWHKLSLRHIAVDSTGLVAVGGQYKGSKIDLPPLIARHRRGGALQFSTLPERLSRSLRHYIGSIAIAPVRQVIAATAPRGSRVVYVDGKTGAYLGHSDMADAGGVAPRRSGGFVLSGAGTIASAVPDRGSSGPNALAQEPECHWDNHLLRL